MASDRANTVHITVTELSPVKRGKLSMYFDGCVTDGELWICIVGLSAEQKRKLASYKEEQAAYLTNCELKPSREGDK